MGFSITGSHLVFFIAAVAVAGVVAGILSAITMNLGTSLSEKCRKMQEKIDIDFKIINDPSNIPNESGFYEFYIKNIGEREIITTNETFSLLIDGNIISKDSYHFSTNSILPSEVAVLYVEASVLTQGNHKMKLVGPHAVEDEFEFEI